MYRLCALLLLAAVAAMSPSTMTAADPSGQYVVLKLDDFGRTPRWQRVVAYVESHKLKASLGIICKVLEKNDPQLRPWVKQLEASGRFDFWHHGYDHRLDIQVGDKKVCEFSGTSYEEQKAHFAKACDLARDKLGLRFTAFGAPGNRTDKTTERMLADFPEIKVLFYGPNVPGKVTLARWANLEQPTMKPNSAAFIEKYPAVADKPYLCLQGHPNQWDDARFAEFEKIVEFLQTKHARFVTASELGAILAPSGNSAK